VNKTSKNLCRQVGFELPNQYNSSRLLWENLPKNADRAAVIHDSATWTYAQLVDEASRIGNHLKRYCAVSERILLIMDDEPAYPAAIMGAMRAGLVPILTNTLSPPDLIEYFLKDSGVTAAIVSRDFESLLTPQMIASLPCKVILKSRLTPWADESAQLPEHPASRTDAAFWMYSSGSTGKPKGIVHRHEDAPYTAHTYGAHILNLQPDDVCFSVPKIFFAYGFGNSVTFPMSRGAAALLLSGRPTPQRIYDQIARHRPSILFALPTVYTAMAHSKLADTADLSCVRLCISAAEILSDELSKQWRSLFDLKIIEGLGSTEALHIYLSNDEGLQKPGSAGRVVPGYAVRLQDKDGKDVGSGEQGVMHVCALSCADSYWNHPKKTSQTMRDGWIVTGDCFVMDEDGFYFYKGRADDLVKVSGQWVYPMEIETALNEHPKVRECCVQAVELADKRYSITAWVSLVDEALGDEVMTADLKNFVKSKLMPHKYPRNIVYMENLPKTGTDKIDRHALKALNHS